MKKEDLLKQIAETGYNVGFGAKKHFATYDIVSKAPSVIGFLSMAIGVFALYIDVLASKHMSGLLIISGVLSLFINLYNGQIEDYNKTGTRLTQLYNELKSLYLSLKACKTDDLVSFSQELERIEKSFYSSCITKQILFSDWYTHYKFFWQHQIEWINEQKNFKFLRDKVPLSFTLFIILVFIVSIIVGLYSAKVRGWI